MTLRPLPTFVSLMKRLGWIGVAILAVVGCGGALVESDVPVRAAGIYKGSWRETVGIKNGDVKFTLRSDGDISGTIDDPENDASVDLDGKMSNNGSVDLTVGSTNYQGSLALKGKTKLEGSIYRDNDITKSLDISVERQ